MQREDSSQKYKENKMPTPHELNVEYEREKHEKRQAKAQEDAADVKAATEALAEYDCVGGTQLSEFRTKLLRAHKAQPQEPVAYRLYNDEGACMFILTKERAEKELARLSGFKCEPLYAGSGEESERHIEAAEAITPESLPDELVSKAIHAAIAVPTGKIDVIFRAAVAAFLNGAMEVGLARKAKASKSYSSTKGECWIASDAWDDDWPVLILRLPDVP
jgi:hypothetical protein